MLFCLCGVSHCLRATVEKSGDCACFALSLYINLSKGALLLGLLYTEPVLVHMHQELV